MRTYLCFFLLFFLFLAGCASQQKHVSENGRTSFIHPLPAVFQANLLLKKCPPTSFELVLRPDGLYFLRMEQNIAGKAALQAEIGAWRYNGKRKTVHLIGYNKAVRTLAVTGKHSLKLLKASGGMMPSLVRYDFMLTEKEPTYDVPVRMQGMYTRKRGRGVLRECLSGASFPVIRKGGQENFARTFEEILHG
ncbi:MAG: hypothetical protein D3910_11370, partial [Candidatus Electrothrix sp. ATG2]|nr:hypothetical protein [Candidatus Electrothrix sp. ATG2]